LSGEALENPERKRRAANAAAKQAKSSVIVFIQAAVDFGKTFRLISRASVNLGFGSLLRGAFFSTADSC